MLFSNFTPNRISNFDSNNLYFNRKSFDNLGLSLDKNYTFTIPRLEEDIQEEIVKGRNESLTKFYGYRNRVINIDFRLKDTIDYYNRLDYLESYLLSEENPILYFGGENRAFLVKRVIFNNTRSYSLNTVSITFIVAPFMVDLNETIVTGASSVNIKNDGHFEIEPIISFYPTSINCELSINGEVIRFKNKFNNKITVDTKLGEIYCDYEILFITDYPILKVGDNVITGTNIRDIEIKYRRNYR